MKIARGLLFAAIIFAVFLPALHNGFIWDDADHFAANPAMTAPDGLRKIWTSLETSRYYPLTLTTFWLQRRLWGLDPLPYHAVNVVFHIISASLIYLVLRKLNVRAAWVAAVAWAVHPVNVESVAWATELKNGQSGMFFFLSLLCFLHSEDERNRGWYVVSLVSFAAALLSKPSTVVLPLVFLLCAWWRRGKWTRTDFVRAVPFFVMGAAMSVVTVIEQRGHIAQMPGDWSLSFVERVAVAARAVWFYAFKVLWPDNLIFVYPRWELNAGKSVIAIALLGIATLAFILWRYRREAWARASTFALSYFIVALLPVLGFFNIFYFRYSFVADHFQYLALAGLVALAAGGAATRLSPRAGRFAASIFILALSVLSWRRAHVFHDDERLWQDTLTRNPRADLALNNLGAIRFNQNAFTQAEPLFREAVRARPNNFEARNNLGLTLAEVGRYAEAEACLQEGLRVQGNWNDAEYGLGHLYLLMNKPVEAERHLRRAIDSGLKLPKAYGDLGQLLQQRGERAEARRWYEAALSLQPDYVFAHNNLARMFAEDGQTAAALAHYELALKAAPNIPELHFNVALALNEAGRSRESDRQMREALALAQRQNRGELVIEIERRLGTQP